MHAGDSQVSRLKKKTFFSSYRNCIPNSTIKHLSPSIHKHSTSFITKMREFRLVNTIFSKSSIAIFTELGMTQEFMETLTPDLIQYLDLNPIQNTKQYLGEQIKAKTTNFTSFRDIGFSEERAAWLDLYLLEEGEEKVLQWMFLGIPEVVSPDDPILWLQL